MTTSPSMWWKGFPIKYIIKASQVMKGSLPPLLPSSNLSQFDIREIAGATPLWQDGGAIIPLRANKRSRIGDHDRTIHARENICKDERCIVIE